MCFAHSLFSIKSFIFMEKQRCDAKKEEEHYEMESVSA